MIARHPPRTWDNAWLDLQGIIPLLAVYLVVAVIAVVRRRRHYRVSVIVLCATLGSGLWLCGRPLGRYISPEVFRFFSATGPGVILLSLILLGLAIFLDRPAPSDRNPD